MTRRTCSLPAGWVLAALVLAWCVSLSTPAEEPPKKVDSMAKAIRAKLVQPITLDKGIDPNTPLKDVLELLADRMDVPMIINEKAFEAIGVQKASEQPVQLPPISQVRLAHVLRLLLGQVKGDLYAGDFLVRPDYLEITTTHETMKEASGSESAVLDDKRILHRVYGDFERRPLDEALRELVEPTGVNVVIDPRVGDKGKTPVTATFNNVFLDTAVELLTDMAELEAVQIDAIFYVTTRDNAVQLLQRRKAKQAARSLTTGR